MSREATIARRLRGAYPAKKGWALFRHVRSALGERAREEGVRIADLIAVHLYSGEVEFIEIKCSAADIHPRREPEQKSAPFVPYASRRWIAVPSPWPDVVTSDELLPEGMGLYSVGTGKPVPVRPAPRVEPAERLSPFELSLLRAAQVAAEASGETGDAPMVEVVRPYLGGGHVGLGCHHATKSLAKTVPDKLPCDGCKHGRPTDREAIEGAIRDATRAELEAYRALIARRLATAA
jgi:hypothetical protein